MNSSSRKNIRASCCVTVLAPRGRPLLNTLPIAAPIVRIVRNKVDGPSLNGALARTGLLQLIFCVLLSAGLLLSK